MDRLLEYASHHYWLASAAVLAAAVVAAYELRLRSESVAAISPQDLVRLQNQGALIIDLRPTEEYRAGHVSGARQMSGEQMLSVPESLKRHKEKTVVVYDDSGSLGAAAVRQLTAQGFTRVFALRGGLAAWRADNLPLSRA